MHVRTCVLHPRLPQGRLVEHGHRSSSARSLFASVVVASEATFTSPNQARSMCCVKIGIDDKQLHPFCNTWRNDS